ncbi:hypothetical protein ABZ799_28185 [Nocardiopsis dassonvillei]|uniref:hypothetical protein n=1 Tax=Nocardiopsis dassonvillei TaxID=2014 RepID=UPI0033CD4C30
MSLRSALILLGTALIAITAGGLQLADGGSWPSALLTAGAAGGVAFGILMVLIESRRTVSMEEPDRTRDL